MKKVPSVFVAKWRELTGRVRRGTPRERVLLTALGVVGVLILLSVDLRLLRASVDGWRATSVRVAKADMIRANAPLIDRSLAERTHALTGRRLTAAELLAAVENTARESGLTADASTPRSERAGRLTLHRMRLTLQSPGVRQLMEFDDRLRLRGDGLAVERVTLESRNTGGEIAATYELVACQPSE